MSTKLARMRGLERIRRLEQELERATLERIAGEVRAVESALVTNRTAVDHANTQSRSALRAGDRGEWLYADAQGEVARAHVSRLDVLLQQREAALATAMASYLATRKTHEQAKALLKNAQTEADANEARRAQAELDNWSVSRWGRKRIVKVS